MSIRAILPLSDFELAMERSFILYLQNMVPTIQVGSLTVPVQAMPPFPYEQYENFRQKGAVITVELSRIMQEGFQLGTDWSYATPNGNTMTDVHVPFRYDLQIQLNCYTSSSAERAKLDGALMHAIYQLNRVGAPVYEFQTETSSATAYDTGSRIHMTGVNQVSRVRSEDIQNHDYLSNWTLNAKALYVFETLTSVATSVSITATPQY